MFKFSSTHIISSTKDFYVNDATKETSPLGKSFVVGKNFKFFEKAVKEVRKALPVEASTETISFNMPELTAGSNCRLYLYIRSVDNADPLYANDWIYKGKPFPIEFKGSDDPETAASNLATNSAKWLNFVFGNKVIEVTNEGSKVTIAVNEDTNLRFYKVEVQEFKINDGLGSSNVFYADGGFETVAGWSACKEINDSYDTAIEVTYDQEGKSGFGTYEFLLKNLRLPTNTNMLWNSVNSLAGEMPSVGTDYVQYIVKQCTERPEVQGTSVVGQYSQSITYHILWVANNEALINAVEEGFTGIGVTDFASIENEEETEVQP